MADGFDDLRGWLDEVKDEVADALEAMNDTCTLGADRLVRDLALEADLPDLLVDDDERAAIDARALGRTLKEIDRLPTA